MKSSVHEISVSPPGQLSRKGIGWSKIFIHLKDDDLEVLPSVTVETHVPYDQNHSFRQARESALNRAKEIIRAALKALDETNLADIDALAQGQAGWQSRP